MKKLFALIIIVAVLAVAGTALAKGWSGYNWKAGIFVGTGLQWCIQKPTDCSYLGPYINDKIVMKWNAEWDRGVAENWLCPPYDAWENNEWNGNIHGGSGAVWHYKIKWDEGCAQNGIPSMGGTAYCLWGQFATVMDQGVDPLMGLGHIWLAHGIPTGYGK